MTLKLYAPGPLKATADPRVKSGLLLPYGEYGLTNKGKVTASAGALTLADTPDPLTLEHVDKLPVADFVAIEEQPDGLYCSVRYPDTPLGNAALAEYEAGTRNGLSVEVDQPVIRAGRLVAGIVTGGSQVETGAFPSAKLAAAQVEDAPDLGDLPDELAAAVALVLAAGYTVTERQPVVDGEDPADTDPESPPTDPETDPEEDEEPKMNAARATVQNAALVASKTNKTDTNKLFAAIAAGFAQGLTGRRLEAALSDVVPANILGVEQPQYVGQLWDGVPYERRYVPLFAHEALNSFSIKGWQWKTRPAVGLYAGNKTDIPSAAIETEEVSGVLQRIAGGHDIDRKFRDFSNAEFWDAYFKVMAESYAKVSDQYIRDAAKAIPTAGNGQRVHLLTGQAPAGVPTALWQIVKGCIKMLDDLDTLPTFALVTSDYWEQLFYTQQDQVLAYLNAQLGFKEGTLEGEGFRITPVPTGSLTVGGWTGKTLIGHREAVTVHELPGSPIRVEAEAISKGGVDEALFGYIGYMVENVKGLISFDAPAAS